MTPTVGDSHVKGGKEVLKMFTILNKEYPNLELCIRAKVPQDWKSIIKRYKNIRLIEDVVPWEMLEKEFKTADILVHPTYHENNTVIPDAMTTVWAARREVEDGKFSIQKRNEKLKRIFDKALS